jgi:hypothetical protein
MHGDKLSIIRQESDVVREGYPDCPQCSRRVPGAEGRGLEYIAH